METKRVYFKEHSDEDAVFVLQRNPDPKKQGTYFLRERFRYKEPTPGGRQFVVPKNPGTWETDLASIPGLATWLVPKDGSHTPAALVHDAMVGEQEYISDDTVSRQEADTIFRQGMQYLGVPLLRRWMMWAAVSMATYGGEGRGIGRLGRPAFVFLTGLFFGGLGLVQTLDLVDLRPLQFPLMAADEGWTISLPWIDDKPFLHELFLVLLTDIAAVAAGIVAWGLLRKGLWKVGLVGGTALLLFAFPLAIAALSYGVYLAFEAGLYYLLRGREGDRTGVQPVNPPRFLRQRS